MARLAGLLGILGVVAAVAFPIYFGALDPSYDPARDFISELGDATARDAWAVNWFGFLPTGLLLTAFGCLAWRALPRSTATALAMLGVILFAVGYVGAAFFPCDTGCSGAASSFSQQMHYAFSLPGYFLAPVTMLLLGIASRWWPGGAWIAPLAFIGAVGTFAGLAGMVSVFENNTNGLWQRVLEASFLIPTLATSCYLGVFKPR